MGRKRVIITPQGRAVAVPAEAIDESGAVGHVATPEEVQALDEDATKEKLYGGTAGQIVSGGLGLASALTFGATDLGLRAAGGGEALREIYGRAPKMNIAGQVVGTILNPAAGLGKAAGKAAAGKVATKTAGELALDVAAHTPGGAAAVVTPATRAAAAKLAGRAATKAPIRGAAVGGAVETGLLGLQQGAHELAIDESPLNAERVVSVLGSRTLAGVGFGGIFGGTAKAAQLGLKRGRRLLQSAREKAEAGALSGSAVDDLMAHQAAIESDGAWLAAEKSSTRRVLNDSQRRLRYLSDEPIGLAENPHRMLDPLRRQIGALRAAAREMPDLVEKVAGEEKALAAKIRGQIAKVKKAVPDAKPVEFDATMPGKKVTAAPAVELEPIRLTDKAAQKYGQWSGVKVTKGMAKNGVELAHDDAVAFVSALENGELASMRLQAAERLPEVIKRAEALEARVVAEGEARKMGQKAPFWQVTGRRMMQAGAMAMAGGFIPGGVAGAVGSALTADLVGKAMNSVAGKLFGAVGKSSKVTSKGVGALLGAAKMERMPSPNLRRFLDGAKTGAKGAAAATLGQVFRKRADELLAQTMLTPDGIVMRPEARMRLGQQLAPVAAISPLLADRAETVQARKVEALVKRLPKRPDIYGPSDPWEPGESEMRSWARFAWATEHPDEMIAMLARGTITPEDSEAFQEVYPERYRELQMIIASQLPTLRAKLPYHRRLALSIFTGQPVDPSLHPQVLGVLQRTFELEEGSEGGTRSPPARPQFGSIEMPEPTPAQERAG